MSDDVPRPPDGLLPSDPDEIARLYRRIRGGGPAEIGPFGAPRRRRSPEGVLLVLLSVGWWLLLLFAGLSFYDAALAAILSFAAGLLFMGLASVRSHLLHGPPRSSSSKAEEAGSDPTSLDVLEPVARHLAEPLLRRAESFVALRPAHDEADAISAVDAKLAALDAHLAVETEPVWREAAEAHRERLLARRAALAREFGRQAEIRARVYAEAEALRARLDLLSRRRDLARALRDEPALPPTARPDADALRRDLAALGASLGEGDRLAQARLAAEREMDALQAEVRA